MRFNSLILFCFCVIGCNAQEQNDAIDTSAEVFEIGGHEATFPGGEDSLLNFVSDNLNLPQCTIWADEEPKGISYARFQVDTLGVISDIRIIKSVHPIYDKAIFEMIKKMPRWVPDSWKGIKMKSTMTLPIQFGESEGD